MLGFLSITIATIASWAAVPSPPANPKAGGGQAGPGGPAHDPIACCLPSGECAELRIRDCVQQGGLPHPGGSCEDIDCLGQNAGACCVGPNGGNHGCVRLPHEVCDAVGGDYHGDGTDCGHDPNEPPPCGAPTFACCLPDGGCAEIPFNDCVAQGGAPRPHHSCNNVACHGAHVGACCVTAGGISGCVVGPEPICLALGGEYLGDGTHCMGGPDVPPPCEQPAFACCLSADECAVLSVHDCVQQGGEPRPSLACDGVQCGGPPPIGACCANVPGAPPCIMTNAMDCEQLGGAYQGDGTHCGDPVNPPPCGMPPHACCMPDGMCLVLPRDVCLAQGGEPRPSLACDNVACNGGPGNGACCVDVPGARGCIMTSAAECEQLAGEYHGDGTHCGDPVNPPCGMIPPVACCMPDGTCAVLPRELCLSQGGQPHPSLSCDNVECNGGPDVGACCVNVPGLPACIMTNAAECEQFGGEYHGDGTHCGDPVNPPCGMPPIACCLPDGTCAEMPLTGCMAAGGMPHNTPSCANVECGGGPAIGACCLEAPGGVACAMMTEANCAQLGGAYNGDGSSCQGDPGTPPPCGMTPPSACCLPDGQCVLLRPNHCILEGGMPQNSLSCSNITCGGGGGFGACCVNHGGMHGCIMVPAGMCDAMGGQFQGDGTNCGDPAHPACP